ncbi:MAG: Gfo/Idh/MocA family protein [Candidatus Bathyarchaeia archaeon]
MKVGIVGAGLQAKRRASVFQGNSKSRIEAVACGHDGDIQSSQKLADAIKADMRANWREIISDPEIEAIIVCTPPHLHSEISIAAMESGKHVLCEKPLARTVDQAESMIRKAKQTGKVLKCGFNHRHHPAILQARRWVDSGQIGQLDFARCKYGICGRIGYENEWRANPKLVGGGQLMEQGIHAIDLFRWFLGDFTEVTAFTSTKYWKNDLLEDSAFVLLRSRDGKTADLYTSLMIWKNTFSFELTGHEGYVSIEGLGGSYGTERAVLGKRNSNKPFAEQIIEYRGPDESWKNEWEEFEDAIKQGREPLGSAEDGLQAMRLVLAAYESNRTGSVVSI